MIYYNSKFDKSEFEYEFYSLDPFLSKFNQVILVLSVSEYNEFDKEELNKKINQYKIEFIFLYENSSADIVSIPNDVNEVYIPVYTFHYNFDFFNDKKLNYFYYPKWIFFIRHIIDQSLDIITKYPISCACRNFNNGRIGKIYNYQLLKNKSYFDKILFTKFKSIEPFEMFRIAPEFKDTVMLSEFLLDYNTWEQMNYNELDLVNSMGIINLDVYNKSLFHLVAETAIEFSQLSEKTYKVFLAKQIPVICGAQYSVKHLRDLGFDMFDDIIDHDHYDKIANWQERIVAMHEILDVIVNLDHEKILKETEHRRYFNQQHLKSQELTDLILIPIINELKDVL